MKISDSLINTILETVDIVSFISEYVDLKRAGREYRGLCPFHTEKTPSFYVSPEKGVYHCFGCGASGNVITFVREYLGFDYIDAVKFLSDKYNISFDYSEEKTFNKDIYTLYEEIKILAKKTLLLTDRKEVKDFLSFRKISLELIDEFDIGYIEGAESVNQILKKYDKDTVEQSGLLINSRKGRFFRFQNRIIFPINNLTGRTVAFSGRALGDTKPKYINSPETPIFSKRNILYNLNKVREFNSGERRIVIVVEGYIDVIRLWEYGYKNAVAPMGTALTENHVSLLKRYSDEVVLLFDGDEAGKKAARRAMDIFFKKDFVPSIVFLPKGEDPDSYLLNKGKDIFDELFAKRKDIFIYYMERANQLGAKDYSKKQRFLEEIGMLVNLFNDEKLIDLYSSEAASIFKVDKEIFKKRVDFSNVKQKLVKGKSVSYICERDFISALFTLPEDVVFDLLQDMDENYFYDVKIREIFKKIVENSKNGGKISALVDDSEVGGYLSEIAFQRISKENGYLLALQNKYQIILNYLKRLKQKKREQLISTQDENEKIKIFFEIEEIQKKFKKYRELLMEVRSV